MHKLNYTAWGTTLYVQHVRLDKSWHQWNHKYAVYEKRNRQEAYNLLSRENVKCNFKEVIVLKDARSAALTNKCVDEILYTKNVFALSKTLPWLTKITFFVSFFFWFCFSQGSHGVFKALKMLEMRLRNTMALAGKQSGVYWLCCQVEKLGIF